MNVIWIVSDSFRRDHIGAYGNKAIRTPSLDSLAAKSIRFDNHYAAGFPTMPASARKPVLSKESRHSPIHEKGFNCMVYNQNETQF